MRLLLAENSTAHIDKRAEAAAAQAEDDRKQAEDDRKAEAAHQKQLATERKRKQAEADAQNARIRAEADAKAAEDRRKIRVACTTIYQNTANKKVSDLTVAEEQKVRAYQALGLYPPQ